MPPKKDAKKPEKKPDEKDTKKEDEAKKQLSAQQEKETKKKEEEKNKPKIGNRTLPDMDEKNIFDLEYLEQLDPALQSEKNELYKIKVDRDIPIEFKFIDDPKAVSAIEKTRIRILYTGADNKPTTIKIELTNEVDLFFNLRALYNQESFAQLQEKEKILVKYEEFLDFFVTMIDRTQTEATKYCCVLYLSKQETPKLNFVQNLDHKYLEIISFELETPGEEEMRQRVQFRTNLVKAEIVLVQNKMAELITELKEKNPTSIALAHQKHFKKMKELQQTKSDKPQSQTPVIAGKNNSSIVSNVPLSNSVFFK